MLVSPLRPAPVARFELPRRHEADRLDEPSRVEPVHPLQRGKLDGFERSPRSSSSIHLRLEEPKKRFSEALS